MASADTAGMHVPLWRLWLQNWNYWQVCAPNFFSLCFVSNNLTMSAEDTGFSKAIRNIANKSLLSELLLFMTM